MTFMMPLSNVFKGFADDGTPLAGGKLYTYGSGGSTPQVAYTDVDLSVAHDNPIVLDVNGEAVIYLTDDGYKLVLKDADDVPLWTLDNVNYSKSMVGLSNLINLAQITAATGTAKGDLIGFTASATPGRIAVGTDGKVLTADSTNASGVSWQWSGTTIISTQSVTAAATIDFTVVTGKRYKLVIQGLHNTTDGYYKITCNADGGNNYSYVISGRYSTGATLVSGNGVAFVAISDTTAGNLINATDELSISIEFTTWQSNLHNVLFNVTGSWVNAASHPGGCSGSGTYAGAANLSTISIVPSAGTFTGTATLYTLN